MANTKKELYDPHPILSTAIVSNCGLYRIIEVRGQIFENKIVEVYTNGLNCSTDFIIRPSNWDLDKNLPFPRIIALVTCRNSNCELFQEPGV